VNSKLRSNKPNHFAFFSCLEPMPIPVSAKPKTGSHIA
jgi:hypothetical protein